MLNPLTEFAYQGLQQTKNAFSLTHKSLAYQLSNLLTLEPKSSAPSAPKVSPEVINVVQQELEKLLAVDWQEAQTGVYPLDLLFPDNWQETLLTYAKVWLDLPTTWQRRNNGEYQTFAPQVDRSVYPAYYLQNFHYQTDGYLSDQSAELYDLQVDLLFNGAADAMRRRILAPLKQALSHGSAKPQTLKVLDVACGTGRTLKFIRSACPEVSLYGVDLSAPYLRKANQMLSPLPGALPQLIQANGEDLPYIDRYFHAVTSVFLFHELPYPARQRVINECFRVLKPGGTLILCDSIQKGDIPTITPMLNWFHQTFHEPYYQHYLEDDLNDRLAEAGFENIQVYTYYVSKYWVAQKGF